MKKAKPAWNTLGNRKVPEFIVLLVILPIFALSFVAIYDMMFPSRPYSYPQHLKSKAQVRGHAQGLYLHAVENGDEFPAQEQWPDDLIAAGIIHNELMISPGEDGDGISSIYVPGPFTFDETQILIYEDLKHWPKEGVLVGFADTHVEFVPFDEFERMLAVQLAQSPPAP